MLRAPMNRSGKLHALLSTARVANIPSVASNVWLGVTIGIIIHASGGETDIIRAFPGCLVLKLMVAAICLYVAGNFLNDWMDREWDEKYRPERGLPRGLFTPGLYLGVALSLAIAGMALAAWVNGTCGVLAAAIATCIVIYTVWHKRGAWTVVPMGLCRGFLPIMGAMGMIDTPIIPWNPGELLPTATLAGIAGTALFCYIMGLSLRARYESRERPPQMPATLFVIAGALLMFPHISNLQTFLWAVAGAAPYALWLWRCQTVYRKPISRYVSALLAGIPLLDWVFLLPVSGMLMQQKNAPLPLILACFLVPPLAFLAALLLQRLAPAT